MQLLTIFILCHNRPDDARNAILSAIGQTDSDYCLTISDNSTNEELKCLVESEFPNIGYIKRTPTLGALEHFNTCINESKSDYFCLFHDDDVLESNFVQEFKEAIDSYPNAIAIGCNAHIERFGKLELKPSFSSIFRFETINSPRNLAIRYFSKSQSGIAPFPSYIYNKKLIHHNRFPLDGGKYSDVTWLLELAKKEPIVWINKRLLTYRLHASNDGNIESRRDRLKFLAYLKSNTKTFGNEILEMYRFSFIYKNIEKINKDTNLVRNMIANRFVKKYRCIRTSRFEYYKSAFLRVTNKWLAKK